jgi:N6-adenosine-specific RNA methylase IME4
LPLGPFPLIYADPPWRFAIYSEKGLERTPDQHYETLTDEQIMTFTIGDKSISETAHRDAALLMWCTSSNLHRALAVMEAWGFEFKTSAVWDKMVPGLGLVFRNQHELLLYGTRGKMPGPQYQPVSVFR